MDTTLAFSARELYRFDAEDGTAVAQLAVGQSDFWLSDESPEHRNFSPETVWRHNAYRDRGRRPARGVRSQRGGLMKNKLTDGELVVAILLILAVFGLAVAAVILPY